MATLNKGYTFTSGDVVTPTKLNNLVDAATVTNIQTADIADSQITTAKIADANVTTAKIADSQITTAKIANNAVTNAKIRDSAALSVIGRSANSTGQVADIDAGTDGHVLRRSGTTLGFGQIAEAGIANNAVATDQIANSAVTAAKLSGAQTGSAPIYGCRAWVNFDGTKDINGNTSTSNTDRLIRASGNVSSVKRNSLGDYTINFTTAMPNANYAVSGVSQVDLNLDQTHSLSLNRKTNPTATSCRIHTGFTGSQTSSGGLNDSSRVSVIIFG
jgi:hypothetical protein